MTDTTSTPTITTSWDDGGPHDVRLAEMLHEYGVKGTFYLTVDYAKFPLPSDKEIRHIVDLGFEIGSHTMTHPDMRTLDIATLARELNDSKDALEQIVGSEVESFCYPFGRFNRQARDAVERAGYQGARTTMGFRTDLGSDPYLVPVTVQMFPHPASVHVRHALKEMNVSGIAQWMTGYRAKTSVSDLVTTAADRVAEGGVLHLWGHSWELEKFDLWDDLKQALFTLGSVSGAAHVNNRDLFAR